MSFIIVLFFEIKWWVTELNLSSIYCIKLYLYFTFSIFISLFNYLHSLINFFLINCDKSDDFFIK